ncbi:MAG: GntR family transcriptional regulator [Candidatus Moraniibacteriota bacterium]|nr:MAG: GntR family transcriptional regulator [Candidatus Moranbacteria bacterium]
MHMPMDTSQLSSRTKMRAMQPAAGSIMRFTATRGQLIPFHQENSRLRCDSRKCRYGNRKWRRGLNSLWKSAILYCHSGASACWRLKGALMKVSEKDQGWFESERSLGEVGDRIFLETRHRILTGVYRPGQKISSQGIAAAFEISLDLANQIMNALSDHGYVHERRGDEVRVIAWTDDEFADMLTTCRDLLELMLSKTSDRLDEETIRTLEQSMDIDLSKDITPDVFEAFHIRWWIFFHTLLYTIEVRSFRKMMLTGAPPSFRRRMFTALDEAGLRSMHSDVQATIPAIRSKDQAKLKALVAHQWTRFTPILAAENSRYNDLADDGEVDYEDRSLPPRPVFRNQTDTRPMFHMGCREPLSWAEYQAMIQ